MRKTVSTLVVALTLGVVGFMPQAGVAAPMAPCPSGTTVSVNSCTYSFSTPMGCFHTCAYNLFGPPVGSSTSGWDQTCIQDAENPANNSLMLGLDLYDLVITVPAVTTGVTQLTWTMTPQVDYDLVACVQGLPKHIVNQANTPEDVCATGVPAVGCTETVRLSLNQAGAPSAGDKIVLRHVNWADPGLVQQAKLTWS